MLTVILIAGCTGNNSEGNTIADPVEEHTFVSSFDYVPEPPENGALFGIIELGYSGFNSFIVQMDEKNRWSLEKAVYDESLVAKGRITLEYVLSKIDSFKKEMIDFGVSENHINLVASSSAIQDQKVQEIARELRSMNIGLITVDPIQEGNYALMATIPPELRRNAYMIDIGSGNTKISWMDGKDIVSIETYGSLYYQENISDSTAQLAFKEALSKVPENNRNICFMVGKIPFLLATSTNNRSGRYTILEHPDTYEVNNYQEQSGFNIYRSIWEEKTFSYVFDWDSNFSIGVLISVN
ncbi:MAG: hypothetical protein RIM99_15425 [Cyclobacteriaceae bacterium]